MNVKLCPDPSTLEAYLRGQLDLPLDENLEKHLEDCTNCQAALDAMDAIVNQPFACLRESTRSAAAWNEPAYCQMVMQAKAMAFFAAGQHSTAHGLGTQVTRLGNYLLLEPIGSGGMGQVYKAQHQRLKKTVALKVLTPALVPSAEARRRFQREMEAVGRLASPHIVSALDAGEENGQDYLVMEYIEGENLSERVHRQGPLSVEQALDYLTQTARGLEHAHMAGIIHRDVKPSNLLLDPRGTIKVLDLGIARFHLEDARSPTEAMTGQQIMGTVAFMAPEQAMNTHQADERSDIYSLGCTLYYLLTGKVLYEGKSPVEMLIAHREQPIPSLQALRRDCPPAVEAFFRSLVVKKPQDRPASMQAVLRALQHVRQATTAPRATRSLFLGRSMIAASFLLSLCVLVTFTLWLNNNHAGNDKDGQNNPVSTVQDLSSKGIALPKKGVTPEIILMRIPAGEFMMGGSDSDLLAHKSEKPRRKVKLNRVFYLGKTEVTQAQYETVMGTNPSAFSAKGQFHQRVKNVDTRDHPVENVSWLDAVRFCIRLSERHECTPCYKFEGDVVTFNREGKGYRLPTEAEWEYACRGGTASTWSFGENFADLKDHAWFAENSGDRTHPVGLKKPNPFGLHDMYGNVPEWCWDRFDPDYYERLPASDPPGSGTGQARVFRGDAWNSHLPRTSARQGLGMVYGISGSPSIIGFRIARDGD